MQKFYKAKYIISTSKNIFENSVLVVENGEISEIIPETILEISADTEVVDYGNAVITPSFINLHAHLQYTGLKSAFISDKAIEKIEFSSWLGRLIKQYYFLSKEKKIELFKLGLKEAISSGCTAIVQLSGESFFPEVLNNSGIRSFVFLETFSNCEERTKKEIEKLKKQIKEIKEKCSDNVVVGISPHSVYNVHKSLWQEIAKLAVEENLLVHTHLAESKDELKWLAGKPSGIDKIHMMAFLGKHKPFEAGLSPVEYLEKLGVLAALKDNLIVAHCIELDEKAFEKLINYGTKIAHCPRSNVLLHGKTLDFNKLPDFIRENTGLGTDSAFSNYDLSIINEARYVMDSTNLEFEKIFDMMTINSARILKVDDKTGTLESSKDADFLVFQLENNELYKDILNRQNPDFVFRKGNRLN
jgi:cytosine/adenosine deaminase-related metal-dependent hydrolase